jgi:hypothetical protein
VGDTIPTEASYRYVKTRGVIEPKARTATDTQRLYKSVLAQVTLRTLHELFGADRHGHLQRIAFNGGVDDIDPAPAIPPGPSWCRSEPTARPSWNETYPEWNRYGR